MDMSITREQFIAGEDLLTCDEVAKRLGLTDRTLRNWRNEGIGPEYIPIGKNIVRYRIKDVVAYEERQRTGGEIPARAENAMRRAAGVLDTVARWKMRDETRATIEGVRDQLVQQLKPAGKEAA